MGKYYLVVSFILTFGITSKEKHLAIQHKIANQKPITANG
jgi:hypothetical protein